MNCLKYNGLKKIAGRKRPALADPSHKVRQGGKGCSVHPPTSRPPRGPQNKFCVTRKNFVTRNKKNDCIRSLSLSLGI